MKKINIIIIILLTVIFSCKEPDNTIYQVFDNVENGAVLRKIQQDPVLSKNFNIFDTQSTWELVVEQQDEQGGDLLSKVNVHISFVDKANNGANDIDEVMVKTIEASEFSISQNDLPITHIIVKFQDALDALNMQSTDYVGGDYFPIRLELVLTDGRTFSAESSSSSLQGSYWSSPFVYESQILCNPDTPITGDYLVNMQDSWGDGWNGAALKVTIDGVATDYTIDSGSSSSHTINVPIGSSTLTWEFVSGAWDSEITFQIIGPNSGDVIGDFGPSPAEGPLGLNYCNE